MTPSSDSCGAQGIRTVLSPSGYIGPSQPVIVGASSGSSQDGGGLLSPMQSFDDSKQVLDNEEPWSCLLVFRLAVGQQLNVSLIDFTAAARAEFSETRFEDGDDIDISLHHHHHQLERQQQHVDRSQKTSSNDRKVRHFVSAVVLCAGNCIDRSC